jgi:HSP20 family protein
MTQQWNWLRRPLLPALPPPRLTADIYETAGGEAYVIEIPIPGLTPEEIVIDVTSDSLTVSTRPQQAESESNRRYVQREQSVGPISRLFEFPEEIDTDQVQATLENGILKIHAPKAAAGRRKVIRLGKAA